MVAVVRDSPRAVWRRPPAWHVDDGWTPGQPWPFTITPTLPDGLRMTWSVGGVQCAQEYSRIAAL
eukprot:869343-Pyramimonas_sp.AAC.1